MRPDTWDKVAYLLVLVGGLNWGLIGFFEYNLVGELFGFDSGLTRVIYCAVGLAAVYLAYTMYMVKGGTTRHVK